MEKLAAKTGCAIKAFNVPSTYRTREHLMEPRGNWYLRWGGTETVYPPTKFDYHFDPAMTPQ